MGEGLGHVQPPALLEKRIEQEDDWVCAEASLCPLLYAYTKSAVKLPGGHSEGLLRDAAAVAVLCTHCTHIEHHTR